MISISILTNNNTTNTILLHMTGGAPWLGLAAHNFELARPSGYSTLWLRPAGAHRRLRNLAKKILLHIANTTTILLIVV